jgi:phosphoribosyl-AMP cyclohydrolase / phosphoribosyl-ATP pyrophosphohydrolase
MKTRSIDWTGNALIPAVVQDATSGAVLMLGYMNEEAYDLTLSSGRVTFFSRSRGRLWVKGETSGHFLQLQSIAVDCDEDALLVLARPNGPTCHLGTTTCWGEDAPRTAAQDLQFLGTLEGLLERRIAERPEGSYTTRLLSQGTRRIAQKVGEEGLEVALAAVAQSNPDVIGEAADLLYHLMLLLKVRQISLPQVVDELRQRHRDRTAGDAG